MKNDVMAHVCVSRFHLTLAGSANAIFSATDAVLRTGERVGQRNNETNQIQHAGTTTHYTGCACSRAREVQMTYSRCTFRFCRSSAKVFGGVSIADDDEADDDSEYNTEKRRAKRKSSDGVHHGILHEFWRSFPSPSLVLQLRRLEL